MIGFDPCGEDAAGCAFEGAVAIDKRSPLDDGVIRRTSLARHL
jgi:hypothetical protein